MTGRYRVTSAYLVHAREPAIVVTHIHLDHAGGAGTIAERFPSATVWVHERGGRHLADPSRLWASAAQVYGGEDRLAEMFGPMQPIDAGRIRTVTEGDAIDLG